MECVSAMEIPSNPVKVYEWNPKATQNTINDELFYKLGNNNKTLKTL